MSVFSDLIKMLSGPNKADYIPERVISIWDAYMKTQGDKSDFSEKLDLYKALDLAAEFPYRVYGIFDSHRFDWPLMSNNLELLTGYKNEEVEHPRLFFFKLVPWEQITYPVQAIFWLNGIVKAYGKDYKPEEIGYSWVGLKFRHKNGKIVRVAFRTKCLQLNPNGFSGFWFGYAEDVTHLLKGNGHWARFTLGEPVKQIFSGHSDSNHSIQRGDILSEREKEILALATDGLSSKEIASQLYISLNTVETHRKNMIHRTNARDLTALIQLARMTGIL